MWRWFHKSDSDIIRERIVSSCRSDIFVQPPRIDRVGKENENSISYIDIHYQTFTPEFAEYCKQYYSKYICTESYYIQFSFMSPPCGRTYENDTNIEIVDYSVCWGNCDYGFIKNPKNNREYIPMRQVFPILCELMNETKLPYTVNVNTVKYNTKEWKQDNMLLTFSFVQNLGR